MKHSGGSEPLPFDLLAPAYDSWFEGEGKMIFAIETAALREILPSLPKPWLEIGVGTGRFARALGIDMGIDPSREMLRIARERGVRVFIGKGEQQIFDDRSFGAVFLILTLCFVESAPDVLKETYRILDAKGKIVLGSVPLESPWGRYYQEKKRQGHPFYSYATFYGYSDMEKMLRSAGFSIETTVSTLFQQPDRVEHMESPRKGFHHDAGFIIIVANKNTQENREK
jgi:ubiquinone/menaquinone biosynthesis C-methylase UbiE